MREKRNFAQRELFFSSDKPRSKYFLVYEGEVTERRYFEAVSDARNEIGIDPMLELVPIVRSHSEKGWSNPKKILDRVMLQLKHARNNTISYETLLNGITDHLRERKDLKRRRTIDSYIWRKLLSICKNELHVSLRDAIEDVEGTCLRILDLLEERTNIDIIIDELPEIIDMCKLTYDAELDTICFIFDRDQGSFTDEQYYEVSAKCRRNGFKVYFSNPCFEFWLLLHFDEVFSLDMDSLLSNPKVSKKHRYAGFELDKLLEKGYHKSRFDAQALVKRIDIAIRNEKKFCEDIEGLENKVGSNVGLLISEMRKRKR